jgi:hypothetical protein
MRPVLYFRQSAKKMSRKVKNIASQLLLMVFLFPSIIKLEHHHEHVLLPTANELAHTVLSEKCAICNFEFSVFHTSIENISFLKEIPEDSYCNNYDSRDCSNLCKFSFLLRAPPVFRSETSIS